MPSTRATAPSARMNALRKKHAVLQERIEKEQRHAAIATELLRQLKREKLRIKDELERERQTA